MKMRDFYRGFLRLYPADFHKQFAEEMLGVLEQTSADHFANRGTASIALVVKEFISIAKGACIMRMSKIFAPPRNNSQPGTVTPTHTPLTLAEASQQHDAAVKNMVTAIAGHDFPKARQYSYEEIRLKSLLRELQNGVPAARTETVG
jgi:hypothetical protein